MKKEFTVENLARVKELFTLLCFNGAVLAGKFGANTLNPFELLNGTNISTLRSLLSQVKKEKNEMEDIDEWSMSPSQTAKKANFEIWAEFLNLLIGYRLDQDEKAATKSEKARKAAALRARIATEEDKGKTLDDMKKELEELEA